MFYGVYILYYRSLHFKSLVFICIVRHKKGAYEKKLYYVILLHLEHCRVNDKPIKIVKIFIFFIFAVFSPIIFEFHII